VRQCGVSVGCEGARLLTHAAIARTVEIRCWSWRAQTARTATEVFDEDQHKGAQLTCNPETLLLHAADARTASPMRLASGMKYSWGAERSKISDAVRRLHGRVAGTGSGPARMRGTDIATVVVGM
jgi:hypothetical protein